KESLVYILPQLKHIFRDPPVRPYEAGQRWFERKYLSAKPGVEGSVIDHGCGRFGSKFSSVHLKTIVKANSVTPKVYSRRRSCPQAQADDYQDIGACPVTCADARDGLVNRAVARSVRLGFKHQHPSTEAAGWRRRNIEPVALHVPGARPRTERAGELAHADIMVGISLLDDADVALPASNVDSLALRVVEDVVHVAGCWDAGDHGSGVHVEDGETRGLPGADEHTPSRLVQNHGEVC